jgi:hypothetical protein
MNNENHEHWRWLEAFNQTTFLTKHFTAPKEEKHPEGGDGVIICDGSKHRTIRASTMDYLDNVTDCDGNHDGWEEKTGLDLQQSFSIDEYEMTRERGIYQDLNPKKEQS